MRAGARGSIPPGWDAMSPSVLVAHFARERCGAARSTCDALIYELRRDGRAALERPNCRHRLADLSTAQVRELIATLIRLRPQHAATITEDLIGLLGDQLC